MKTIREKKFYGVSHLGRIYVPPIYDHNFIQYKDESKYLLSLSLNSENVRIVLSSNKNGTEFNVNRYVFGCRISNSLESIK